MKTPISREQLNALYQPPSNQFSQVAVPEMPFLMMEMNGEPEQEIAQAISKWLYTAIHPIRRKEKEKQGKNFLEPPIEALFAFENSKIVRWRMMIVLPVWVDEAFIGDCLDKASAALGPAPGKVLFEDFTEGPCVQIMHIGDIESQKSVLNQLYITYLPQQGFQPHGWYHEIYLNDHQRVAPEKRKTVLRQAIKQ